jgi:peptidyl-tRNA hydrolase ICT1
VWPICELTRSLPKLMHAGLRASKYYASGSDSLIFQAQTQRDRSANTEENLEKLAEELRRIYRETVPGVTDVKKIKRYEAL